MNRREFTKRVSVFLAGLFVLPQVYGPKKNVDEDNDCPDDICFRLIGVSAFNPTGEHQRFSIYDSIEKPDGLPILQLRARKGEYMCLDVGPIPILFKHGAYVECGDANVFIEVWGVLVGNDTEILSYSRTGGVKNVA